MPDQPDGPFCECGRCDATGREGGGPEIRLPHEAWAVAGAGDLKRLAVHPDHLDFFEEGDTELTIERHDGWVAIG